MFWLSNHQLNRLSGGADRLSAFSGIRPTGIGSVGSNRVESCQNDQITNHPFVY